MTHCKYYAILSTRVKEVKLKDRPSETRREYIKGDIERLMFTLEPFIYEQYINGMVHGPVSHAIRRSVLEQSFNTYLFAP